MADDRIEDPISVHAPVDGTERSKGTFGGRQRWLTTNSSVNETQSMISVRASKTPRFVYYIFSKLVNIYVFYLLE